MKTHLLPLLPLLALSTAGVSAQNAEVSQAPKETDGIVCVDVQQKPTSKPTTQSPLEYRTIPDPQPGSQRLTLVQPRFTMPVEQHDLMRYPMPVTQGNGLAVRIPVAPPVVPKDPR